MSDIVERLRADAEISQDCSSNWEAFDCSEAMREAASEIERLRLALSTAHAEGMEEAARIAEEEDEMPGVCPPHVVAAMERIGPIENARAAVRTAKHSIAAAIRLAKESKT